MDVIEMENTETKSWVIPAVVGGVVVVGAIGGYILWRRKNRDEGVELVYETTTIDIPEDVLVAEVLLTEDAMDVPMTKLVEADPNLNRATNPKVNYAAVQRITPPIAESAWQNPPEIIVTDTEEVSVNVFAGRDDSWDLEMELSQRHSNLPYILSVEEYTADDMGFKQVTCTYYGDDDTMVDPYDTIIHDHAKLMGELRFGYGSKDPSTVYIRNEAQEMEYEVILYKGSYAIEVLGEQMAQEMDRELRHSHSVPRMRRD